MSSSDKPNYRESDDPREISEGDGKVEKPSQRDVDKGADSIIENKGKWKSGSDRGPDFVKAEERQNRENHKPSSSTEGDRREEPLDVHTAPNINEHYDRDDKDQWSSGGDRKPDAVHINFKEAYEQQQESEKQQPAQEGDSGEWSTGGRKGPDFKKAYEQDLEESDKE